MSISIYNLGKVIFFLVLLWYTQQFLSMQFINLNALLNHWGKKMVIKAEKEWNQIILKAMCTEISVGVMILTTTP